LSKGTSPAFADNLLLWDKAKQKYVTLYLYAGAPGSSWDGKWIAGTQIATNKLATGEGFWLRRYPAAGNTTITMLGEIPTAANNPQTFVGNTKFSMFGSGYSAPLDVNADPSVWSAGQKGSSPAFADNLLLWDKAKQKYVTLYLYAGTPGSSWDGRWIAGTAIAANVLQVGEGAWYRRAPSSADMAWNQAKPYNFPND
jgi:hypothetical protein